MKNRFFDRKPLFFMLVAIMCLGFAAMSYSRWTLEDSWTGFDGQSFFHGAPTGPIEFLDNDVVFFGEYNRLYKWDFNANYAWWVGVGSIIRSIAMPTDNPRFVAYGKDNGTVGMRYTKDLRWRSGFTANSDDHFVAHLAIDDQGTTLAGAYQSGSNTGIRVKIWHVAWNDNFRHLRTIRGRSDINFGAAGLAMTHGGTRIFVNDGDQNTDEYIVETGRLHIAYPARENQFPTAVDYSSDVIAQLFEPDDGGWFGIHLWDYIEERYIRTIWLSNSFRLQPTIIEFSHDGQLLAVGYQTRAGSSGKIELFNVRDGSRHSTILLNNGEHRYGQNRIAFSPNGKYLACWDANRQGQILHWKIKIYRWNENGTAAPVATAQAQGIPVVTTLLSNYPNPFNPETWIPYQLAESAEVTVTIHSADGKLLRTLELGKMPAGVYQDKDRAAHWNGKNEHGEPVASGIYFYTFKAGNFSATKKMVIRK